PGLHGDGPGPYALGQLPAYRRTVARAERRPPRRLPAGPGHDGALSVTRSPVLRAIVTTRPSPPISGTAQLTIRVVDGLEQPVPEAQVKLTPLMPSHGHIEPISAATPLAG